MDRSKINFNPVYIHQEEEPDINDINTNTEKIINDIDKINKELVAAGQDLNALMSNTKLKLKEIKNFLEKEKERQEDMNIICNRYTDFASVITLAKEDFYGNLNIENNILSSNIRSFEKVDVDILDINGNGYEGNSYVYDNGEFLNKIIDSSNRQNIVDGKIPTYYEYSRITVNDNKNRPIVFNKDSNEAECSIEFKADKPINKMIINSDRNDIILSKVFTSNDGLIYKLDKEYNIAINERYERYNNQNYIYGSGIIAFESSNFVKIYLRSNGHTNEKLAYVNTFHNNVGDNSEIIKKTEIVEGAKRHVIKINDIITYKNYYNNGKVISKELITSPVKTIALYCNEYIPDKYNIENNISYYLIINGVEHNIQPINSHRNGKKIIRMSAQSYKSSHVIYLNEDIKSAKLKIVMNSVNPDITPYVSDIKILIGGK